MSKTYTVAEGREFVYPDFASQPIVAKAGGLHQLSQEDRAAVRMKTVRSGQDCSDMPASSLAIFLERGWVIEEGAEVIPPVVAPVEEGVNDDE